ncbi:predicted protein [Naegleria gruberi]|uniref:Predicted protein n=1 Tax=Naegleria gruberi TaxID=5762 RepID=D2VAA6_NAEGR|nr:uncharacterized protein NAEGRDRAFT_65792 [Naegleria gruberi]EFC46273.1 predicted protein [Naegleria gruberi]|eukprot:XP_002679017.1 predicted protein [Naegleria gruberi strain NEG-M]
MGSERGDLISTFYVGNCYNFGVGREVNVELAMEWYEKAANAGHGMSCFLVADKCHQEKDFDNAMKWYSKGAELGLDLCFHRLGYMIERGEGCERDLGKAFEWFHKAANCGIPVSMYSLGVCYERGIGCEINEKKSMEWYVKAARKGNQQANAKVTLRCTTGIRGDYDFKLAYELFLLDATVKKTFIEFCSCFDMPISKFYIAQELYYENARNDSYNSLEIIEMLESTQQLYQSQNLLGLIYLEGKIVEQNFDCAFKLIEKAAESKKGKCLFDLAIMYLYGYGCKKDSLEARYRLKQLAIEEYQPAIDLLERSFHSDLLKNRQYSDLIIVMK